MHSSISLGAKSALSFLFRQTVRIPIFAALNEVSRSSSRSRFREPAGGLEEGYARQRRGTTTEGDAVSALEREDDAEKEVLRGLDHHHC